MAVLNNTVVTNLQLVRWPAGHAAVTDPDPPYINFRVYVNAVEPPPPGFLDGDDSVRRFVVQGRDITVGTLYDSGLLRYNRGRSDPNNDQYVFSYP